MYAVRIPEHYETAIFFNQFQGWNFLFCFQNKGIETGPLVR